MQEAGRSYVSIPELLEKAGNRIAELAGVDACYHLQRSGRGCRGLGRGVHGGVEQRPGPPVARHGRDEGRGHRPTDADQLLRAHDPVDGSPDRPRRPGQSNLSLAPGGGLHPSDGRGRPLSRLFAPHRSAHRAGHRTGACPWNPGDRGRGGRVSSLLHPEALLEAGEPTSPS